MVLHLRSLVDAVGLTWAALGLIGRRP